MGEARPPPEPEDGWTSTSPRPSPHRLRRLRRRGEGETLPASRRGQTWGGSGVQVANGFGEFSGRPSTPGRRNGSGALGLRHAAFVRATVRKSSRLARAGEIDGVARSCSAGVLACEFWRRLAAGSLDGKFPGTGTVPALAAGDGRATGKTSVGASELRGAPRRFRPGDSPQKLAARARERKRRRRWRFAGAVHDAKGIVRRGGIVRSVMKSAAR